MCQLELAMRIEAQKTTFYEDDRKFTATFLKLLQRDGMRNVAEFDPLTAMARYQPASAVCSQGSCITKRNVIVCIYNVDIHILRCW